MFVNPAKPLTRESPLGDSAHIDDGRFAGIPELFPASGAASIRPTQVPAPEEDSG